VTVTMAKLGNTGSFVVADPTLEEELCMETRLTIAINIKGNIVSIQKGGISGGVNPSELNRMLQSAKRVGLGLLTKSNELLRKQEEEEEAGTLIKYGFFA
jgi:exosome complex component RRP42